MSQPAGRDARECPEVPESRVSEVPTLSGQDTPVPGGKTEQELQHAPGRDV